MDQLIHRTDEQLEDYVLGRLSDSEEQETEEHLLLCNSCRHLLDQNLVYVSGMREASRERGPERDWLRWARPILAPRYALAGVLAALVLSFGLYIGLGDHVHYAPVAALQLTAIRGETPAIAPTRELDMTLNSFPASGAPFKVEIVDANGTRVWNGSTDSPRVDVHEKFRPGSYFVRLYTSNGDLLHEYGFRVGPGQQ